MEKAARRNDCRASRPDESGQKIAAPTQNQLSSQGKCLDGKKGVGQKNNP